MMPLSFKLIFVYFLERYDYLTYRKGKSKKEDTLFYKKYLRNFMFWHNYMLRLLFKRIMRRD